MRRFELEKQKNATEAAKNATDAKNDKLEAAKNATDAQNKDLNELTRKLNVAKLELEQNLTDTIEARERL